MASSESLRVNLSEDPQALGRELVRCFQVAIRLGRTHGWGNEASQGAVDALANIINVVVAARGEFGLHVASDFLYLDDDRLRTDGMRHGFLEVMIGEMTTRGIGSVFVAGRFTEPRSSTSWTSSTPRTWGTRRPRP